MEASRLNTTKRIPLPDDFIRSLAIILVIVLHASNEVLASNSVGSSYWWTGAVYKTLSLSCVPLFVMLSGALLLQPSKLNEPIGVFLKKRLSRIGLAFAFWTAVYLAWSFFTQQIPLTLNNVSQGILKSLFGGAYYQFWFLYLIIGLYLFTPILRVIISYGDPRITGYLIALWFAGIAIVPLIQFGLGYTLDAGVFVLGGFIGYFVMGSYLQKITVRNAILYGLLIASFFGTIFGMWFMTYPLISIGQSNYFLGYLTINVIVGSAAIFMITKNLRPDWPSKPTILRQLMQVISRNTLPIFLLHVIILECFFRGFFGFTLTSEVLNPIIEVPLIASLTLFITLGLVLLMRRVPVLKNLIG